MDTQDQLRYVDTVEGIDVEKRYDEAEFPFPSIVYDLASTRHETVTVTVADVLPAAVDAENVGFHRDQEGEHWTIDGDRLVFERELRPDTECRTIYAVGATEIDDPEQLFVEPAELAVSPPEPERTNGEESGDAPDDPDGDADADADIDSDADADGDEETDDSDPLAPTGQVGENGESAEAGDTTPQAGIDGVEETGDSDPSASLVGALAGALRAGDYDESDLEAVAAALDETRPAGSGSVDARVSTIEDDLAKLRAYTDALEAFLDGEGGAEAVIDGFEAQLSALEDDVESVDARSDDLERRLSTVQDATAGLEEDVEALDEISNEVDHLRSTVSDLEAALPADERLEDLEARMAELERFVGNVQDAFE